MVTWERDVTLRSGETMRVRCVEPPDEEYLRKLRDFLSHKGRPWFEDILARLRGERAAHSADFFFVGEMGGEVVGHIWYTVPRDTQDVGTLGHVYTRPDQRGKGICHALMEAIVESFKGHGGEAMFLSTGNPQAIRIYEHFGFRKYNPPEGEGGIYRWLVVRDFDERHFAYTGKPQIREANWGDLPRFEALYNCPHPWLLRDYSLGVYRDTPFESQFLQMMKDAESEWGAMFVMSTRQNHVVGAARVVPGRSRWEEHVATLEFFVHPNYFVDLQDLLSRAAEAARDLCDILRAFAPESDKERHEPLRELGFEMTAVLENQYRIDGKDVDLLVYTLTFM